MARLLSGGCAYFAWSGAGAGDLSLNTARLAREEGGAEADYLANKVTRLLDCTEDGYNQSHRPAAAPPLHAGPGGHLGLAGEAPAGQPRDQDRLQRGHADQVEVNCVQNRGLIR